MCCHTDLLLHRAYLGNCSAEVVNLELQAPRGVQLAADRGSIHVGIKL